MLLLIYLYGSRSFPCCSYLAVLSFLSLPSLPRPPFIAVLSFFSSLSFPRFPFCARYIFLPCCPLLAVLSFLSLPSLSRCHFFAVLSLFSSLVLFLLPFPCFPFLASYTYLSCCPLLAVLSFSSFPFFAYRPLSLNRSIVRRKVALCLSLSWIYCFPSLSFLHPTRYRTISYQLFQPLICLF